MNISTLLIIIVCLSWLLYIVYATVFRRVHLVYEIVVFALGICILILNVFPQILYTIEHTIGILEFVVIIFLCLFVVLFVIVFELYHAGERHRREITKLSQEIALLQLDKEKGEEKNGKHQKRQ